MCSCVCIHIYKHVFLKYLPYFNLVLSNFFLYSFGFSKYMAISTIIVLPLLLRTPGASSILNFNIHKFLSHPLVATRNFCLLEVLSSLFITINSSVYSLAINLPDLWRLSQVFCLYIPMCPFLL